MTRPAGRRRWPTWAGAIAIGLVFLVALGLAISRREVKIVLWNRAAYPLTGVSVEYPGGTLAIGEIPPGTSFEASIWPSRPSNGRRMLTVRLTPGDGPPFESRRELGPVASWEVHSFVAHGTTNGPFLFWGLAPRNPDWGFMRGVYRLLHLD